MQFAQSSALREKLYRAYVTRASDKSESKASDLAATPSTPSANTISQDNTTCVQEILALRHEEAQLLGYANYAEVSLASKMAQSPAEVMTFLRDLAKRAKPYAEKDVAELREFAAKQLNLKDPQAWDWTYIGEKLKEARYAFSEQEVKMYFTAPKVLAGLFKIVETLFEVSIRKDTAPVWHEGVEFFRIERAGALVG
jgi:oligopeptidase A